MDHQNEECCAALSTDSFFHRRRTNKKPHKSPLSYQCLTDRGLLYVARLSSLSLWILTQFIGQDDTAMPYGFKKEQDFFGLLDTSTSGYD